MLPSSEPVPSSPRPRRPRRRSNWSLRFTAGGFLILLLFDFAVLALVAYLLFQVQISGVVQSWLASRITPAPSPMPTYSAMPVPSPTRTEIVPTDTATPTFTQPSPASAAFLQKGLIVLSLTEGVYSHLFAYQPRLSQEDIPLALTRLTDGPWDDLSPAISPDGQNLVFVSNRSGYWDLYLLELVSGRIRRLTDSLEYDGAPAWSPDGVWIVYESYVDDNLDLFILNAQTPQPPIRLTSHPAADSSPVWSPQGRQIAFVSTRSGGADIWLADLDQADEKLFVNLSRTSSAQETHPAWSGDGRFLAWAVVQDGIHEIVVRDFSQPDQPPRLIGSGDWPVWSPEDESILTGLFAPYRHYLTAYSVQIPGLVMPLLPLPGFVTGLDWGNMVLPLPLHEIYRQAAQITPTPLWLPALTVLPEVPEGRSQVVRLQDVQAPHPFLHDMVDEAFQALRQFVAEQAGWDFLASLENAFVPLTSPLDPGMSQDWLYTGRAFAFNTAPLSAGWLAIVREDYGVQTYWRVFLRSRFQDGSSGMPLKDLPWDFFARFGADTGFYELGGSVRTSVPVGYWLDFTQLAAAYGWQRQEALSFWRASLPAARFNEFAFTAGLEWSQAMAELYPPEALITPTSVMPATRTPSPTPRWYQSPTPTATLTPRPTLTPLPPTASQTPTALPSITSSSTRQPSLTVTLTGTLLPSASLTP